MKLMWKYSIVLQYTEILYNTTFNGVDSRLQLALFMMPVIFQKKAQAAA